MKLNFGISLSLAWLPLMLFMGMAVLAQDTSVVDTNGNALMAGQEYYIEPAITDVGGRITLIDRNNSCPLYVGQENVDAGAEGFPVIFTPFAEGETVVKLNRDFKVAFSAITLCIQSLEWKVGVTETETRRRLIVTGPETGKYTDYFRIEASEAGNNIYNLVWCPTEVCPFCRFQCGTAGGLVENGKILLALDGNVLPVVFVKAA